MGPELTAGMAVSSAARYPKRSRRAYPRLSLDAGLPRHYRLVRQIGRGGSSVVHLAIDERYDRRVAVKMLRTDRTSPSSLERFRREITTMACLRHPNILPVYDSGEVDGRPFYVAPFIGGGTLADQIQERGCLPWTEAMRIAVQVAGALSAVHAERLVHLDVKPGNILLEDDHAVLADFGVARSLARVRDGERTDKPAFSGTPCYMSPEQAVASDVDERADVYSLACLLYEMLVGEPPFNGPSPRAICAQQLTQAVPSVREAGVAVPECAENALRRALSRDPSDRFQSVAAFASACQRGTNHRAAAAV